MNGHKHTPGPWTAQGVMNGDDVMIFAANLTDEAPDYARSVAMNGGKGCIARVRLPHVGMVEAQEGSEQGKNASLIMAAPRVLASLKRWAQYARDNLYTEDDCTFLRETLDAIAEAEGGL